MPSAVPGGLALRVVRAWLANGAVEPSMSVAQRSVRTWGPAALFVVLTVAAALAGAVRGKSIYAPDIALLGLQTIAIAWYTALSQHALQASRDIADQQIERLDQQEHDARRRSATAILSELAILSQRLDALTGNADQDPGSLEHPVMSAALAKLPPFDPPTIDKMVTAAWYVDVLANSRRRVVELADRLHASRGEHETEANVLRAKDAREQRDVLRGGLSTRAVWAYNAIMDLAADLLTVGGHLPTAPPERWLETGPLPQKASDLFPRAPLPTATSNSPVA